MQYSFITRYNAMYALGFTSAQAIYMTEGWASAVYHPTYSQSN